MSDQHVTDSPAATPVVACSDLLSRWSEMTNSIREWKRTAFPHRCIVKVNAPSYKGYGIVMATGECDTDKLPVMLENGNTWWYPVEGCERITDMKQVPAYARRQKLKLHGCYKLKAA